MGINCAGTSWLEMVNDHNLQASISNISVKIDHPDHLLHLYSQ